MEILFFINNIGGLKIKRSLLNRIKLSFYKIQLTFKGIKCVNNIRRFDANLIGLIKSFLSSFVFAILAITLTAILIYGANFSLSNYAVYSFIFLSSIFVSSIIHEYVHIYYSRKLNNTPSIIVDGIRIGVLSRIKDPRIILLSSLHGPLAGFISCIAISIILFSLGLSLIFYLIPLLASLVHLFSILPIYGDGKYIWKYIKNKQLRINHA